MKLLVAILIWGIQDKGGGVYTMEEGQLHGNDARSRHAF